MNKLPLSRSRDIIVQSLGKEILLYDLRSHKAYNLNETSAVVYQACDGKTSFEELRIKNKFTDDIIFLALDELRKANLLEENQSYNSPFAGMTRREAIRKAGVASMIALPVISSLAAPIAADAQSSSSLRSNGTSCTADGQCLSNCCLAVCSPSADCFV